MVRWFEQEYAAQRSGTLYVLLLRNKEYDRSKMAAAFPAPQQANAASTRYTSMRLTTHLTDDICWASDH